MKPYSRCWPAVLLLVWGLLPFSVHAQTPSFVVDAQNVVPEFPQRITFSLTAHATNGGTIARADVSYRVRGDPYTRGVVGHFTPAAQVTLTATVDTQLDYIPPGVIVDYYWTLADSAGHPVDTASAQFRYDDGQFRWQTRSTGSVRIHWHSSPALGDQLTAAADAGLARLATQTGVTLTTPVEVWVYASDDELQAALPPDLPEWVGGKAFPALGVIVTMIADDAHATDEARRILPHELAHIAVYPVARNPYTPLPVWLDEGIAVNNQLDEDPSLAEQVEKAARARALLPLRTLESSFPADPDQATLSYAESVSAVHFLLGRYSTERLQRLLTTFQQGVTVDAALQQALGVTTDQLDAAWQATLPQPQGVGATPATGDSPAPTPSAGALPPASAPTPAPGANGVNIGLELVAALAAAICLVVLVALLGGGVWFLRRRAPKEG